MRRSARRTARRSARRTAIRSKRTAPISYVLSSNDTNSQKITDIEIPIKVSNNTVFDIEKIKSMIHTTILKKGTKLWRTQPGSCKDLKKMECEDTGKRGIYLGTNKYTPIGMILEYNKPMKLCQYVLTKDVLCFNGKYIFRLLEPERYFKNMDDLLKGDFIFNVLPSQSTNHIDGGVKGAEDYLLPIDPIFDEFHSGKGEKLWKSIKDSEVFLTDPNVLKSVTEEKITVKQAKEIITKLKKKI